MENKCVVKAFNKTTISNFIYTYIKKENRRYEKKISEYESGKLILYSDHSISNLFISHAKAEIFIIFESNFAFCCFFFILFHKLFKKRKKFSRNLFQLSIFFFFLAGPHLNTLHREFIFNTIFLSLCRTEREFFNLFYST